MNAIRKSSIQMFLNVILVEGIGHIILGRTFMGNRKGKNDKFAYSFNKPKMYNQGSLQFHQTLNIQTNVSTTL